MVCRLTEQKGVPLLIPALEKFLHHQVQVVIVGSGDPALATQLQTMARDYPDKLAFINAYDDRLAHLVEAGADFFLMPSLFEPCGLNQMYSLAYGTLPLVRAVGGLKDTVVTGMPIPSMPPASASMTRPPHFARYHAPQPALLPARQGKIRQGAAQRHEHPLQLARLGHPVRTDVSERIGRY